MHAETLKKKTSTAFNRKFSRMVLFFSVAAALVSSQFKFYVYYLKKRQNVRKGKGFMTYYTNQDTQMVDFLLNFDLFKKSISHTPLFLIFLLLRQA